MNVKFDAEDFRFLGQYDFSFDASLFLNRYRPIFIELLKVRGR